MLDNKIEHYPILRAYQTPCVGEQDHALWNGPLFWKDTKKIPADVVGVFMALLLWRCMQAGMRKNQAHLGISLPYPHKVLQPAPTTKRLKEIVASIQVLHWRDGDGRLHRSRAELSVVPRQALLLVGVDSRRITHVPSG